MYKKIVIATASVALMLATAVPAFASDHHNNGGSTTNVAIVSNSSSADANTGNNDQGNYANVSRAGADDVTVNGNNNLTTGRATANATAGVVANNQVGCACSSRNTNKNVAVVNNYAGAGANSGGNFQGNGVTVDRAHVDDVTVGGNNNATTGKAKSNARSWVLVNNQVSQ